MRYPLAAATIIFAARIGSRVLCLWQCKRPVGPEYVCVRGCGKPYNRVRDCGRPQGWETR